MTRTPANRTRSAPRAVGLGLLLAVAATAAPAQTVASSRLSGADSLLEAGDLAARASKHREAIRWYTLALQRDTALHVPLLARMGRQYLWADDAATAARLLDAYVRERPDDCEVRRDAALALSWQGALDDARTAWEELSRRCRTSAADALLGQAMVTRWANQPRDALRLYRQAAAAGDLPERQRAAIGTGFTYLDLGEPRRARAVFDSLQSAGDRSAESFEGRARSAWDLGHRGHAREVLASARSQSVWNRTLGTLDDQLQREDNPGAAPAVRGFRDRDGTTYRALEVSLGAGVGGAGTTNATVRRTELRNDSTTLESNEGSVAWRARPHAAVAFSVEGGVRQWSAIDRTDGYGEATITLLPTDRQRFDMTAARLLVTDNVSAVTSGLAGQFASAGISQRLGTHTTVSASGDGTWWNTGNTRWRARATVTRRLDGVPSLWIEWPTVVQLYDEPFAFNFFSPEHYVETGPALSAYKRYHRVWHLSAYGRGGALRETGGSWQPLGAARFSLEREVVRHWGVRGDASWTNSNLAGSAGFQRTALALQITGRW